MTTSAGGMFLEAVKEQLRSEYYYVLIRQSNRSQR